MEPLLGLVMNKYKKIRNGDGTTTWETVSQLVISTGKKDSPITPELKLVCTTQVLVDGKTVLVVKKNRTFAKCPRKIQDEIVLISMNVTSQVENFSAMSMETVSTRLGVTVANAKTDSKVSNIIPSKYSYYVH